MHGEMIGWDQIREPTQIEAPAPDPLLQQWVRIYYRDDVPGNGHKKYYNTNIKSKFKYTGLKKSQKIEIYSGNKNARQYMANKKKSYNSAYSQLYCQCQFCIVQSFSELRFAHQKGVPPVANYETETIVKYRNTKPAPASDGVKKLLISAIMELTNDERKELLAMWKGRKNDAAT